MPTATGKPATNANISCKDPGQFVMQSKLLPRPTFKEDRPRPTVDDVSVGTSTTSTSRVVHKGESAQTDQPGHDRDAMETLQPQIATQLPAINQVDETPDLGKLSFAQTPPAAEAATDDRSWLDRIPMSALLVGILFCLLMAIGQFGTSNNDRIGIPLQQPTAAQRADHIQTALNEYTSQYQIEAIPIKSIAVGMRVPAHNPELSDVERQANQVQVDPQTWRKFTFDLKKETGGNVRVTLLRSADWLLDQSALTEEILLAVMLKQQLQQQAQQPELGSSVGSQLKGLLRSANDWVADQLGALSSGAVGYFDSSYLSFNPLSMALERVGDRLTNELQQRQIAEWEYESDRAAILAGQISERPVYLDLPELGAQGFATLIGNEACPVLQDVPGQLVTATFVHQSASVLDLQFVKTDGEASRFAESDFVSYRSGSHDSISELSVTAVHPFWVESKERFVAAGELKLGDTVIGINNQLFRLCSIVPRAGPETVYNFEVATEHVYFVNNDGILVHNAYSKQKRKNTHKGKRVFQRSSRPSPTKLPKRVNSKTIRFTQDTANNFFRNRQTGKITGTVEQLIAKLKKGGDTPPIRVFEYNNRLFTLDNRRLYAYQKAGRTIPVVAASSKDMLEVLWKFTTKNKGKTIGLID